MELSQDDIDLIDRFNNGELSGEELASFNERMKDANFASSVALYNETIKIIRNEGRDELRSVLASIQSKLVTTGGFEKYNPGKSKNGGDMWSWIIGIILVVAVVSYFFLTGKINPGAIKNLLKENEVDTVYHYIYHTDTIVKTTEDSVSVIQSDSLSEGGSRLIQHKQNRKIIRIDTVYQDPKSERF